MKFKTLMWFAAVAMLTTSCSTPKNITYFQDQQNGEALITAPVNYITAQPDDRLTITVHSKDPQLAELFNLSLQARRTGSVTTGRVASGSSSSSNNQVQAYTVDSFGDIQFPILGTVHVGGMTRQQIASTISEELINRKLLMDPTVTVEFLDHSFTALGDFGSPGRIIFDRDKLNIIEAIGLAGDLNMTGERENVTVYRMEDGKQKAYTVNLTDAQSLYTSPVYYIQQNDVIYVEPNDKAKRETTANGNSPFTPAFWLSLASFAVTIAVLIVK